MFFFMLSTFLWGRFPVDLIVIMLGRCENFILYADTFPSIIDKAEINIKANFIVGSKF